MAHEEITHVKGAFHNPEDPRHFMTLTPVAQRIRIYYEVLLVADSREALLLSEVGRGIYPPSYYFPRMSVSGRFREREERTTCPLKGEATYYDLLDQRGDLLVEKACWSYEAPPPEARPIAGRFCFYPTELITRFDP